jgi:hypothetical protein
MKVYVLVTVWKGIIDDPEVFTQETIADAAYQRRCQEAGVTPEDPSNDYNDVRLFEVDVKGVQSWTAV